MDMGSIERGDDGFAALYAVAEFDLNFGVERQVEIAARTELDEADAVAALHGIAFADEGHDAARDEAGDEAQADFLARLLGGGEAEQDILVVFGAVGLGGAEEFAGLMFEMRDGRADGGVLHVNID